MQALETRLATLTMVLVLGLVTLGQAKQVKVGIVQLVEHPSLDAARIGFLDGLEKNGYGVDKVKIEYQNAQGDFATASMISQQFVNSGVDLILAIATPAAQAAAHATSTIPIVFTAVTDPVQAGLVKSLQEPGGNITGVSDLTPIALQIELLKKMFPNVKTIGAVYNPGEANSAVQKAIAEQVCKEYGLRLITAGVSSTAEVYQAAQSLVGRVDAFYVWTDNAVVTAIESMIMIAEDFKIPLIAGEDNSVEKGALATVGISYYDIGVQTGEMAAKILDGASPAKIPVGFQEETMIVVNLDAAKRMGVNVSPEIIDSASKVIQD